MVIGCCRCLPLRRVAPIPSRSGAGIRSPLKNVLIGEVWVCSGQSNMEMCETWGLPDVKADLPTCANDQIRFFHVPRTTSMHRQDDVRGGGRLATPSELKTFSAVGYFFGKTLNKELDVPVGLIEARGAVRRRRSGRRRS